MSFSVSASRVSICVFGRVINFSSFLGHFVGSLDTRSYQASDQSN
jgi:hypothetical protein